jgi:putative DNA primase/helicase
MDFTAAPFAPERRVMTNGAIPIALDLAALETVDPKPPAFIVDGWLPAGEVALLAGHGGTGKSFQTLHLGACIALGRPWHDIDTQRRRVAYFSFEDGGAVLHWRLTRICRHLGVKLGDLAAWLTIYDGTRSNAVLFGDGQSGIETTPTYEWLRTRVKDTASQCVIIDGVSDTYASNENARANVKAFVRAIRNLIPADGAAILIAHVDKGSANNPNTSQGYSGSTGWNNSVRSRWYLRPEVADTEDSTLTDGRLVLELQKSNYAQAGAMIPLRWDAEEHMHVRDEAAPAATGVESDLRDVVFRVIEKCARSGNHVPAAIGGAAHGGEGGGRKRPSAAAIRATQSTQAFQADRADASDRPYPGRIDQRRRPPLARLLCAGCGNAGMRQ